MKNLGRIPLILLACTPVATVYIQPASAQVVRGGPAMFGIVATQDEQPGQGALVGQVLPGGTAAAIGVKDGDVIVQANGKAITSTDEIIELARSLKAGDRVTLRVRRADQMIDLSGLAVALTPG